MLKPLKRWLDNRIRNAYLSRGQVIVRADQNYAPPDFAVRFILREDPPIILDLGANEGQFVDGLRASGYRGRIISFEPQPDAFTKLRANCQADGNWECHQIALGEHEGSLPMHISAFSPSSSLLPIGQLHLDLMPSTQEVQLVNVPVVRLDRFAENHSLHSHRLFLKIDVQGYEIPVLRGADALLQNVDGALVELNFAQLFDGQSLYYEVMTLLENAGLHFITLSNPIYEPNTMELLWADGIFRRGARPATTEKLW